MARTAARSSAEERADARRPESAEKLKAQSLADVAADLGRDGLELGGRARHRRRQEGSSGEEAKATRASLLLLF